MPSLFKQWAKKFYKDLQKPRMLTKCIIPDLLWMGELFYTFPNCPGNVWDPFSVWQILSAKILISTRLPEKKSSDAAVFLLVIISLNWDFVTTCVLWCCTGTRQPTKVVCCYCVTHYGIALFVSTRFCVPWLTKSILRGKVPWLTKSILGGSLTVSLGSDRAHCVNLLTAAWAKRNASRLFPL